MVSHPPQPGPSNSRSSQAPNQRLSSEPPQTLKLLLIGSSSVGKSSLLLRFTDQVFLSAEESSATIGVDFKFKLIDHKGKRYKLSIWDTAGQERFRTLTSSYYRGAQGVLLVYDVTNRASFESLPSWFSELDTFAHSPQDVVRVIVGNKVDKVCKPTRNREKRIPLLQISQFHPLKLSGGSFSLQDESRTVSVEEGRAFASDNHAMFFETSVKTRKGVDEVFEAVVDQVPSNPPFHLSALASFSPIFLAVLIRSANENDPDSKLQKIVDSISLQRARQGYRNDGRTLPGSIDLDAYSDDDQAGSWCSC